MDRGQAHALLNQVKLGMYVSQAKINEALYTTGDLDVHKIAPKPCQALRSHGNESVYCRSSSLESEGIGERPNWTMEWNRLRSGGNDQRIEE